MKPRKKIGKNLLTAAKRRSRLKRQRVVEERRINYLQLPPEIRSVVGEVRRGRLTRDVWIVAGGAGMPYLVVGKPYGIGAVAGGATVVAVSNAFIKKRIKTLERLIGETEHPRISELRKQYPFFLVDWRGNIVFTTRNRVLKLFGRARGKTKKGNL